MTAVEPAPSAPAAPNTPAAGAPADPAPAGLDAAETERRDAFAGRLFGAVLGSMDLLTIFLGDRLGLYRALLAGGPATSAELATRSGTHERYAREWLEQQAASGILDVERAGAPAATRRYALPPGHAEVLTDLDSPNYLTFMARFIAAVGGATPKLLDAFRTGGGVSWAEMGPNAREAQGEANRPVFLNLLGTSWLPSIPDVHARLASGTPEAPVCVADVACGTGWSSIAIALAYPGVQVDGFDLDAPSIELARANAAARGVADRVRFHIRDAAEAGLAGQYDLVLICEALHDLSDPVGALRTMRRMAGPEGAVLVVDERVGERFTAPSDDVDRLMYGFSVLNCLPNGMAEQPSAATGTVMRPDTLRRYAAEADFGAVEILPIEHEMLRVYRLRP